MEEEELPATCNFLKDPLSLGDLVKNGTKFEINMNFDDGVINDIFDELNVESDDEEIEAKQRELASPWTKSFEELKEQMVQINKYMYKKVVKKGNESFGTVKPNSRVCIRYNAYWEGEGAPFDSSYLRGLSHSFYTGRNEVLEGLEAAVGTMHKGEEAHFVISYHLLFREMGCPPRIKPKADGLFLIELISFNEIGDAHADKLLSSEDRNKFSLVYDKVKQIHLKGLDFFGQNQYKNACRAFEKAANLLNYCHMANEDEVNEQKTFLIKLYTNLTICYNKINAPNKTCIVMKELRYLTNNKPSCKALFQEGRALLILGDYVRSRMVLVQAQKLEPNNVDIGNELNALEERYTRYKETEKDIWTRAMGIMKESKSDKNKEHNDAQFVNEMRKLLISVKSDKYLKSLAMPEGLTRQEIDIVTELAESLDMKLVLSPLNNNYELKK